MNREDFVSVGTSDKRGKQDIFGKSVAVFYRAL